MDTRIFGFLSLSNRLLPFIRVSIRDDDTDAGDVGSAPEDRVEPPFSHIPQRIRGRCVVAPHLPDAVDGSQDVGLGGVVVEMELELRVLGVRDDGDLRVLRSDPEHPAEFLDECDLAGEVWTPDAVRCVQKEDDVSWITALTV